MNQALKFRFTDDDHTRVAQGMRRKQEANFNLGNN